MKNNTKISLITWYKYRNKNWIALTHVFPDTDTYKSHILKSGEIGVITKICNYTVTTMEELRKVLLKQKGKIITVDFEDGKSKTDTSQN